MFGVEEVVAEEPNAVVFELACLDVSARTSDCLTGPRRWTRWAA